MLVYYNKLGKSYCGDALELINILEDNSVDLLLSSPPYPLINEKEYGNERQEYFVEWFMQYIKAILPKIKVTGSIVLDFGNTWVKGIPAVNVYQFEILIKLIQECNLYLAMPFYWYNPSRLPLPSVYTSRRKIRPKDNVNNIWWLCKDPNNCKANTTNVLVPYSKSMKKYFKKHVDNQYSWSENKGALPSNVLEIPNTDNRTQYHVACRSIRLKVQPSTMPAKLVEFFIKMLTTEGDTVLDIFAGSNTTGMVANNLNRQWISFEQRLDYVAKSSFRFINTIENAKTVYDLITGQCDLPIDINLY